MHDSSGSSLSCKVELPPLPIPNASRGQQPRPRPHHCRCCNDWKAIVALAPGEAAASFAAERTRLWEIVWQLDTLTGCTCPFSSFVREKLDLEQRVLSGRMPQGPGLLLDMQTQARVQREEGPISEHELALEYDLPQNSKETLELYRAEFEETKACSRLAVVQLQLAALEVTAQREAARQERDALSLHEGYQKAKKEFRLAFVRASFQPLVRGDWLAECRAKAELTKDYGERFDLAYIASPSLLRWSPPYGPGAGL